MGLMYSAEINIPQGEYKKEHPLNKPEKREYTPPKVSNANESSPVVHPSHYNQGKYEVIDVITDWGLNFNLGNTVKYVARAGHKNPNKMIEDLEKAMFYLNYEIERLKNK